MEDVLDVDLLFIAVPKCAGTSTINFLQKQIGLNTYLSVNCDKTSPQHISKFKNNGHSSFSHGSVTNLLNSGIISREYYQGSFKFCFVRNPWDRAVSIFFYQKLNETWEFKDFINYLYNNRNIIPTVNEKHYEPFRTNKIDKVAGNQWNQMVSWIPDDINFIGRFET